MKFKIILRKIHQTHTFLIFENKSQDLTKGLKTCYLNFDIQFLISRFISRWQRWTLVLGIIFVLLDASLRKTQWEHQFWIIKQIFTKKNYEFWIWTRVKIKQLFQDLFFIILLIWVWPIWYGPYRIGIDCLKILFLNLISKIKNFF